MKDMAKVKDGKTEQSTTISKALMGKIVDKIDNSRELEYLRREWLVENFKRTFKEVCHEGKRNTLLSEIRDKLVAEGFHIIEKKKASRYETCDVIDIIMTNIKVELQEGKGWERARGDYHSISVYLFNSHAYCGFSWVSPDEVVEFLRLADSLFPEWQEEGWQKTMLEAQKKAKMKAMNESTIRTMVAMKMVNTGIPFAFVYQKQRVKVIFDVGHNIQMEMGLSHKKFAEQIDKVIQNTLAVKKLMDENDIAISMKKVDKSLNWYKMEDN